MRSKKNSSLILLGVFTLGITQSYMVGALPESSADLANESNNEIKQQNIDVQQGTDDQNVDSKDENLLYINDDKKTKNISRVTKAMCVGGGVQPVLPEFLCLLLFLLKKRWTQSEI